MERAEQFTLRSNASQLLNNSMACVLNIKIMNAPGLQYFAQIDKINFSDASYKTGTFERQRQSFLQLGISGTRWSQVTRKSVISKSMEGTEHNELVIILYLRGGGNSLVEIDISVTGTYRSCHAANFLFRMVPPPNNKKVAE